MAPASLTGYYATYSRQFKISTCGFESVSTITSADMLSAPLNFNSYDPASKVFTFTREQHPS